MRGRRRGSGESASSTVVHPILRSVCNFARRWEGSNKRRDRETNFQDESSSRNSLYLFCLPLASSAGGISEFRPAKLECLRNVSDLFPYARRLSAVDVTPTPIDHSRVFRQSPAGKLFCRTLISKINFRRSALHFVKS